MSKIPPEKIIMDFSKIKFTIKFSSRSKKEFEKLDKTYKTKVVECLKTLSLDPVFPSRNSFNA